MLRKSTRLKDRSMDIILEIVEPDLLDSKSSLDDSDMEFLGLDRPRHIAIEEDFSPLSLLPN